MNDGERLIQLEGFAALHTVRRFLWRRNQQHIKIDVLDNIHISDSGIEGWLFTSGDGLVKSKSRSRYNIASLTAKFCPYTDTGLLGGSVYTQDCSIWKTVTKDVLEAALQKPRNLYIVSLNQVNLNLGAAPLFVMQSFESKKGKNPPKSRTFVLCSTKPKVRNSDDYQESVIPNEFVRCTNRAAQQSATKFTVEFIQAIESKNRIKIDKISLVLVPEYCISEFSDTSKTITKFWLHHVKVLSYSNLSRVSGGSSVLGDASKQHGLSTCSSITRSIVFSSRKMTRCAGDFCGFLEEDEGGYIGSISSSNLRIEMNNAIKRHRLVENEDAIEQFTRSGDLGALESSIFTQDENDRHEINQKNEDAFQYLPSMNPQKYQAMRVHFKSIALAREDIHRTNDDEFSHTVSDRKFWPENLYQWWLRIGIDMARQRPLPIRLPTEDVNSAVLHSDPASSPTSKDGDTLGPLRTFGHLDRPSSALINLTTSSSQQSLCDSSLISRTPSIIRYDLSENAYGGRVRPSVGPVSWAYNMACVCHRCYRIYSLLDQRRMQYEQQKERDRAVGISHISGQSGSPNSSPNTARARKEAVARSAAIARQQLEEQVRQRRLVEQRASVDRLVHSGIGQNTSSLMLPTEDMPPSESRQISGRGAVGGGGISRTVGPVPWNLSDKKNRDEYENVGSSFIRNISKKTEEISNEVKYLIEKEKQLMLQAAKGQTLPPLGADYSHNLSSYSDFSIVQAQGPSRLGQEPLGRHRGHPNFHATNLLKPLPKRSAAPFNPDKLLHPWQRELNELRSLQHAVEAGSDYQSQLLRGGKKMRRKKEPKIIQAGMDVTQLSGPRNSAISADDGDYDYDDGDSEGADVASWSPFVVPTGVIPG